MLTTEKVKQIQQLLTDAREHGQPSYRRIAARAGVNRGTVAAIDKGTRKVHPKAPPPEPAPPASGPVERCGTCGAKVQMPCLKCKLEGKSQ